MSSSPAAVASPCTNVCRMDARSDWCLGCMRTLDEIAGWSTMDDTAKRALLLTLPERRETVARCFPLTDLDRG